MHGSKIKSLDIPMVVAVAYSKPDSLGTVSCRYAELLLSRTGATLVGEKSRKIQNIRISVAEPQINALMLKYE